MSHLYLTQTILNSTNVFPATTRSIYTGREIQRDSPGVHSIQHNRSRHRVSNKYTDGAQLLAAQRFLWEWQTCTDSICNKGQREAARYPLHLHYWPIFRPRHKHNPVLCTWTYPALLFPFSLVLISTIFTSCACPLISKRRRKKHEPGREKSENEKPSGLEPGKDGASLDGSPDPSLLWELKNHRT